MIYHDCTTYKRVTHSDKDTQYHARRAEYKELCAKRNAQRAELDHTEQLIEECEFTVHYLS